MDQIINKQTSKVLDADGLELPGSDEYKYYGAAKDLPKVRELFEKDKPQAPIRNYEDLNKKVGYDYFGFGRQDDPQLLKTEQDLETQLRNQALEEYKAKRAEYEQTKKRIKTGEGEGQEKPLYDSEDFDDFEQVHDSSVVPLTGANQLEVSIKPEDIKKLILQKKKEALIRKYASEAADDNTAGGDKNMKISEM